MTMKPCHFGIAALCLALVVSSTASAEVGPPEIYDSIQNDISLPVGSSIARAAAVRQGDERESTAIRRPKLDRLSAAIASGPLARAAATAPSAAAANLKLTFGPNILGVGVGFQNYFVPDAPTDVN